jgi:hypothetical protein
VSELAKKSKLSAKRLLKTQVSLPLSRAERKEATDGFGNRIPTDVATAGGWFARVVGGNSPRVKGPTPRPGRRSRVTAPMAVPSQRRLTGTVAGDGDPTADPGPPPTIAGDLCVCIAAAFLPLVGRFVPLVAPIGFGDSRGLASTPIPSSRRLVV